MISFYLGVLILARASAGNHFLVELNNKTRYIYPEQELKTSLVEQVTNKKFLVSIHKHSNFIQDEVEGVPLELL